MSDSSDGLVYRGPRDWNGASMPRTEDVAGLARLDLAQADFAGRSKSVIAFRAKRLTRRMTKAGFKYHGGGLRWDVRPEGARPQGRDHPPEVLRRIASCFSGERTLEEWRSLATAPGKRNYEKAFAREGLALVVQMFCEAGFSSRAIQRALGLSASQVTRLGQHELPNMRRVLAESFTSKSVGRVVSRDGSYDRVHIFHKAELQGGEDEVTQVLEELYALRAEIADVKETTAETRRVVLESAELLRERFPSNEDVSAAVDLFITSVAG